MKRISSRTLSSHCSSPILILQRIYISDVWVCARCRRARGMTSSSRALPAIPRVPVNPLRCDLPSVDVRMRVTVIATGSLFARNFHQLQLLTCASSRCGHWSKWHSVCITRREHSHVRFAPISSCGGVGGTCPDDVEESRGQGFGGDTRSEQCQQCSCTPLSDSSSNISPCRVGIQTDLRLVPISPDADTEVHRTLSKGVAVQPTGNDDLRNASSASSALPASLAAKPKATSKLTQSLRESCCRHHDSQKRLYNPYATVLAAQFAASQSLSACLVSS